MSLVVCVPCIQKVTSRDFVEDDFNRPDQINVGTASDSTQAHDDGVWNTYAFYYNNALSQVVVADADDAISIDNNTLVAAGPDPDGVPEEEHNHRFRNGLLSRLIPGTTEGYQVEITLTREAGAPTTVESGVVLCAAPDSVLVAYVPSAGTATEHYTLLFSVTDCRIVRNTVTSGGFDGNLATFSLPEAWWDGTHRIGLRRIGAVLRVVYDGAVIGSVTDPNPLVATRWAGVQGGNPRDRYEAFYAGPYVPASTISVEDSFNRTDTDYGTLGTTSDGLATWLNEDPDPGFGFRILGNVARGSAGTNIQTIDVQGTTPGIVSGTLVRGASAAQGAVGLVYGLSSGPTSGEFSYIRLNRFTAFADLYSIEVVYDGGVEEELASLFGAGIAGQKVGIRRDGLTVELYVNDALHSTYTITTPLVPPVGQKHGIRVTAQSDCWVENWSFAKDA